MNGNDVISWQTFQYFVAMFQGVEGAERLIPHTIAVIETKFHHFLVFPVLDDRIVNLLNQLGEFYIQ